MNIKIIAVGKIKEKFFKDAISEYQKRLQAYCKLEIIELNDEKAPENLSEKETELVKEKEAERILSKIKEDAFLVSLEILGKEMDSIRFSNFIRNEEIDGGGRDFVFVIGGSNGLGQSVSKRSNFKLSFSKMTYPHQLMRVILIEQIYRAYRIIKNHPYHK